MNAMKRRYLWVGGSVVAITALAVPTAIAFASGSDDTAPAEEHCAVLSLPLPEGKERAAGMAVSTSGEYMVGMVEGQAVGWWDGGYQLLNAVDFEAVDVNSSGLVVGPRWDAHTGSAEVWTYDIETKELTKLDSRDGEAVTLPTAINDNGDVVGNTDFDEDLENPSTPLKWEAGETHAVALELEEGNAGEVTDINDDGIAVGSQRVESTDRAWTWDSEGAGTELPEVPGADGEGDAAIAANGDWVLSNHVGEDGTQYRWDLAAGDEPRAVEIDSAFAVDAQGRAFGHTEVDGKVLPARQDADGVTVLDALAEEPADGDPNEILDVSATGDDMIGNSTDADGLTSAAEWGCTQ